MYYTYILTNKYHTVFYVGFTRDIFNRTYQHKSRIYPNSFSNKYNVTKLVYFEEHESMSEAKHRERLIKRYPRDWKKNLILAQNPMWKDLFEDFLV